MQSTSKVERLNQQQMLTYAAAIVACSALLGACMANFTQADLPYLDAIPTTISVAAAWLQARKVLQSWLLFVLGNVLFIGIYASKGLYITIVLYVVSTALAAFGYLKWRTASQSD